ncbi:MAG: GrrA/OscA1 family cyclophane-containing rSAM-modified RiPP [Cyanobacteriota bacterium]|nr:GrrA/OscA1 family cyclophane-containing rSAM-modified RiPP [Cyanobacteriota bacterium]
MTLLTHSRLIGILLIAASLPMDPGLALSASRLGASADAAMEVRLQRIAAAVRARQLAAETSQPATPHDALLNAISAVVVTPGGVGWANGGWGNGGFYNGGFGNGGFRNGGFANGGFRNGGFANGGFRNGGGGGSFRNGGFRNW